MTCLSPCLVSKSQCSNFTSYSTNISHLLNCSESTLPPWMNWELDTNNLYHIVSSIVEDPTNGSRPNWSTVEFPSPIWGHRPAWEIILKSSAFIPFVIGGVFGNALIISAVICNCVMRTSTNLLLANMAIADMATLLICPAMFICADSYQNYIMGKPGCKMEGFFNCAFLLTAVLNVTAISYDRLTAVALPQEARLSQKNTLIIMFSTWCIGAIFSAPFIVYRVYKERQWANFLEKYCTENKTVLPHYWNVIIVLLVWLPLAIMVACYTVIVIKLHRYEKKVQFRESKIVRWKVRVIRITLIVLIVFIICRIPYTALIFWRAELLKVSQKNQILDENFVVLWFISRYLIYINAAINPFIYGFSNENFKRALRRMEMSKWLFSGNSGSSEITPTPKKNQIAHKAEHRESYLPNLEIQQTQQEVINECKPKTESTECYM